MAHLEKISSKPAMFHLTAFLFLFLLLLIASPKIYCFLRNISSIPRGLPFLNPDIHYMPSPAPAFH